MDGESRIESDDCNSLFGPFIMAKYHIGIIRPQGYKHSDCFREVAEGLQSAFRSLGHTATPGENSVDAQANSS
jgi:hypothetical protein